MIAVIQPDVKNWSNRETMKRGLEDLGYELLLYNDTDFVDYKAYDAFYGNCGWAREIINKNKLNVPFMGTIPDELLSLAGRTYEKTSLTEAIALSKKAPIFIKPIPENQKHFTGFVLDRENSYNTNIMEVAAYEGDVIISEVKDIVSEYRLFIWNGEIMDSKRYKGTFRVSPDYSVADKAISLYKSAPVSYSLDLGVTRDGKTIIIECNDMMSLGLYGMSPIVAARMLVDRWEEIYNLNGIGR